MSMMAPDSGRRRGLPAVALEAANSRTGPRSETGRLLETGALAALSPRRASCGMPVDSEARRRRCGKLSLRAAGDGREDGAARERAR
jgi:hypothetical protein